MTKQQQTDFLIAHIIDKMTQYLIEDFKLDIPMALNLIYNSKVYEILLDKKIVYTSRTHHIFVNC